MAKRSTLWVPFTTGSNTSLANTQSGLDILGIYATQALARFKGTILAVKGLAYIQQDAPSNALERYSLGMQVKDTSGPLTQPDLFDDITKQWLWRADGFIGGPAGDSTALANLMAGFMITIDGKSKRTMTYSEELIFCFKTSGAMKLGAAGRLLLLEA